MLPESDCGDRCITKDSFRMAEIPRQESPRSEPEILPPLRSDPRERPDSFRVSPDWTHAHRIYVTRLGPFGATLVTLAIGLILAALIVLAAGFLVIGLLVGGVLTLAAIVAAAWKRRARR
jgi:hypothetical protein